MAKSDDTPLMQQWRDAKSRHPEALVFFRVGDFYELFHDDAREASRILGLTLTARNNGAAAHVPMAGIPAKSLPDYLARLVRAGRHAAICEQVEDASEAKGIVRREVVETVTPGTATQDALLTARKNTFLVAVAPPVGGNTALAAVDLSTGEFHILPVEDRTLVSEIGRMEPAELLVPRGLESRLSAMQGAPLTVREDWLFDAEGGSDELRRHFGIRSLEALGFGPNDAALVQAAGALIQYLREVQPAGAGHLQPPRILRPGVEMTLDEMTRRNLELVEPLRAGAEGGTLVSVLDETVTPMGGRLLRRWILRPLLDLDRIRARQDAVAELVADRPLRDRLADALEGIHDLERLAGKVGGGRVNPRELRGLGRSLEPLPRIQALGEAVESPLLQSLTKAIDPLHDLQERILGTLADHPPTTLAEGGVIRPGTSIELDELRTIRDGAVDFIASLQVRERERTGISSLKVGFNRVFGYYLEITRAHLEKVPDDYVRKQTLTGAERYFTPELKDWEEKVTGAEARMQGLETELFTALRSEIAKSVPRIQSVGARIAELDTLVALARVAVRRGYVRPEVRADGAFELEAGRHPVVETMMPREDFIPNDVVLDDEGWIVILTGPNMAGKSTILRQVGLIQLLAQIGSFVPAAAARLPVCDRIFTRVGASDNLARGESTFMVEMNETAAILAGATRRSLVLLDEIGRGTSTYDGVSIAWAVTEHLHDHVGARTIFATHYHELTQLGDLLGGVKNMNVAVRESGDDIVFLRRLEAGGADRSYGIQVARLAGLPPSILTRARALLLELEGAHARGGEGLGQQVPRPQLSLFSQEDPIVTRLRALNIDSVTPLEALNLLSLLQREARDR